MLCAVVCRIASYTRMRAWCVRPVADETVMYECDARAFFSIDESPHCAVSFFYGKLAHLRRIVMDNVVCRNIIANKYKECFIWVFQFQPDGDSICFSRVQSLLPFPSNFPVIFRCSTRLLRLCEICSALL